MRATLPFYAAPASVTVHSPAVSYTPEHITARYTYDCVRVSVREDAGTQVVAEPAAEQLILTTQRRVPRVGVMIVGWGGNNGTTLTAGILANKRGITWRTKAGEQKPDYLGSMTQASTVRLGSTEGRDVYIPFSSLLPMVSPNDIVLGGWDISRVNLADAMVRAEVLDYDLQRQLYPLMEDLVPLPSVYVPDFIAANQGDRADNVLTGSKAAQVATLRQHIRDFKAANSLDKVIVLWSANTERYSDIVAGVNDSAEALLAALDRDEAEISPSTMFAIASILEGCTYINGSPQNTFVPGVIELATRHGVFIGGDDFKSGQTKMKSVMVDFLVSAGIKPTAIVSYNHLGNNDGKNLSAPQQFRSKEISKSSVVDDMVDSNTIMYPAARDHPDHVVVIKYVPYVGDSKRALDEYTSRIFMGGHNTIAMHNTCEDSLLAAPLMIDLIVIAELMERITIRRADEPEAAATRMHSVLSLLAYMLKAPLVAPGTPVINALFKQREALVNVLRACIGLPPENHMLLEHRVRGAGRELLPCLRAHDAGKKVGAHADMHVGGFGTVEGGSAAAPTL